MHKDSSLDSHACYVGKKQTENKYGTTRENMSMVTNQGVKINSKAAMAQLFTVILVQLGTGIEKYKGSLEAFPSIR